MEALRLDSHNIEALTCAGETSFQLGDYTQAAQYLKAGLVADPTSEKTRQDLALAEMVLGMITRLLRISALRSARTDFFWALTAPFRGWTHA